MTVRTLTENLELRQVGTPGAYSAATTCSWVHVAPNYRRVLFVCNVGDLSADCVLTVKQATSNVGAGAANLAASVTATFANGTDESLPGMIEVLTDHLTDGYEYVTLSVAPGASTQFSAVALLGQGYEDPAPNASTAFVVRSAAS